MSSSARNYLGFDLSTTQLKAIVINSGLNIVYEATVDFDKDLPQYGTTNGVLRGAGEGEIYSPVPMWLEAIDRVLARLQEQRLNFASIAGLSGGAMQHGTVYWSDDAESLLSRLDQNQTLSEQLIPGAFTHLHSPNWQDSSTQEHCEALDSFLGSTEELTKITGSKAHHRFSGPQIRKFAHTHPDLYAKTARISLVSSFAASLFAGKISPIDAADAGGTNLFSFMNGPNWHDGLLYEAGGADLKAKLGPIEPDGGASYGNISKYFVQKYGFNPACKVIAFTGDNPATLLSVPLKPNEAIISLGTSTTFLMSTENYSPNPEYHVMRHPTRKDAGMFMLCYKNGGLAREAVRDSLNKSLAEEALRRDSLNRNLTQASEGEANSPRLWTAFNNAVSATPPLGQTPVSPSAMLGLYFPLSEIVPPVRGTYRAEYDFSTHNLTHKTSFSTQAHDARAILESQFLSIRLRTQSQITSSSTPTGREITQLKRIYLAGGASVNRVIAEVCGSVLGSAEGVYRLDIVGGNACALGAAHKALWGCERRDGQGFEEFLGGRWKPGFLSKVDMGYKEGVWEKYGDALEGFKKLEMHALTQTPEL